MSADNPLQLVFIDPRVPDIQDLLDGLRPGEQAFVIDPSSDGIQQIADILAANDVNNLASISIVSHGETGELELGSSFVTDSNLADHAKALAEIGAALAPGGNIQLFGCDVARGAAGQQFINDFSTFAGGAVVEAATHPVGSSGGWTLDASSSLNIPPVVGVGTTVGSAHDFSSASNSVSTNDAMPPSNPINVPLLNVGGLPAPSTAVAPQATSPAPAATTAPFTSAALANFQGTLAAAVPNAELWIASDLLGGDIVHVDNVGGTAANVTTLYAGNSTLTGIAQVALDPTDQTYFVLRQNASLGYQILKGSLVQAVNTPGASPSFTTIFTETQKGTASGNTNTPANIITQMAPDTVNHQIYFIDSFFQNTDTNNIVKFERINFDGTGLTTLGTVATGGATGAVGFALDLVNHDAVFAVNSGGSISFTHTVAPSSFLYEATGVTAGATSVSISQLPISGANTHTLNPALGFFTQNGGVAIDPTTHKLYFTLENGPTGGGLFEYDLTGNPNGNFTTIWHQTAAGPTGAPVQLVIDPATHQYFIGFDGGTNSVPDQFNGIWSGLLTSNAAPTAFLTSPTFPSNGDAIPQEFSLDQQPTLSITTSNPTFTESISNPASANNTPVAVLSSATAGDPDNSAVVSATVSISSGFFAGDKLTFTNNHNITGSYSSSSGVLTFSGVDSFIDYQNALASVTFTSTSENPTNFGADASRTLSFTVNDGLLDSTAQTETVAVVGTNDAPVNHLPVSLTGNEDHSLALTGMSVTDVDANPATQNIIVAISVLHGTLTVATNVAGGLVAAN
ncbi:MAG TPA: DUF4347 domain-containing protein, partial [Xanthobacteraceae bacterium]